MITSYASLQTEIAAWLNRDDLTSEISTFIANGEGRLNRMVRHREMQTSSSVALDANGEANVPSDYIEWRLLTLSTTPESTPRYVEPDSREFMYRFRPYANPQFATVVAGKLKVQPAAQVSGTLYYYAKLPALSTTNTTNWLLDRAPDAYLYAALVEAASYMEDGDAMTMYSEQLQGALTELAQDDRASRLARTAADPLPLAPKTQETQP